MTVFNRILISAAALSFVVLASFGVTLAALTLIEPREPPVIRLKPTIAPFTTRVIEYRYC
jgi:hypothetical protein